MTILRSAAASLIIIGTLAGSLFGATQLQVELGWNNTLNGRRWTPVFITVSDSTPKNATIEVTCAHDRLTSMKIRQAITLSPQPATYVIYCPLPGGIPGMNVVIRDPKSFKPLADWNPEDQQPPLYPFEAQQLIGISGNAVLNGMTALQFFSDELRIATVDQRRLPATPIGYDAFNLLVLSEPDLNLLSADQQLSIVQWVRAGGQLMFWVGEQPIPPLSPLQQIFPAAVGDTIAFEFPDETRRDAGLSSRFRTLKGRELKGIEGATPVKCLDDHVTGWRQTFGYGTVTIFPVNMDSLQFDAQSSAGKFWKPILDDAIQVRDAKETQHVVGQFDAQTNMENYARSLAMEQIGDIPGTGQFGFSYVTLVLIGMMILVGPVDWLVLKRLGRQPWTWVTTTGWITLITMSAVYIGTVIKSGDLHFRTLRLIDEADGQQVARYDAACIYSPKTTDYEITADPDGWWEPLSSNEYYGAGSRADVAMTSLNFHQDYRGTRPESMQINIWNMKQLLSETIASAPAIVESKLHLEGDNLVGEIINHGNFPLQIDTIEVKGHKYRPTEMKVPAGATQKVNVSPAPVAPRRNTPSPHEEEVGVEPTTDLENASIWNISGSRSAKLKQMLTLRDDVACIIATVVDPPATMTLSVTGAIEKHLQYIRAVVPLEKQ